MKRFHVHVSVSDLPESVRFYSTLFGAEPTVAKPDYAKWMLDDPRVNFAISSRAKAAGGIEHLGIQVENETELAEVYARLGKAGRPVIEEAEATCCYAESDKQWIADPEGIAWETFLTHGATTVYGNTLDLAPLEAGGGCCTPNMRPSAIPVSHIASQSESCCTSQTPQGVCCPPKPELTASSPCCESEAGT